MVITIRSRYIHIRKQYWFVPWLHELDNRDKYKQCSCQWLSQRRPIGMRTDNCHNNEENLFDDNERWTVYNWCARYRHWISLFSLYLMSDVVRSDQTSRLGSTYRLISPRRIACYRRTMFNIVGNIRSWTTMSSEVKVSVSVRIHARSIDVKSNEILTVCPNTYTIINRTSTVV
jgi:hypothetical protein